MTHIAIDPGSCHQGKEAYIDEIVQKAKDANVDSVKFQLFPNRTQFTLGGNVYLERDLFSRAYKLGQQLGVPVTASIFGEDEDLFLRKFDIPYVKVAYSQKTRFNINYWLERKTPIVITSDIMTRPSVKEHELITHLWTATINGQTLYPIPFLCDFEGLFPHPFQGFSDHTFGTSQACAAVDAGATWIEKHVTPEHADVVCPDSRFAIPLSHLEKFVKAVKS